MFQVRLYKYARKTQGKAFDSWKANFDVYGGVHDILSSLW